MFPTPNLDHITSNDYENVYEPAEDTFLFLDALEKDIEFLKNNINPCICLEIGSGTGCVSTFLGQLLGDGTTHINPYATAITVKTAIHNSIHLDAITTNLTSGLLPRLYNNVDILCFNPPYVVTSSEDVNSTNLIERAWAGGIDGREVIDKILPLVNDLLSSNGVFYLLVISDNKPDEICERMWNDYKFQSKILASRLAGREKQLILKFWRNQS
ncbi:14197_t:CDS:2 [Cetraspora pellucida]|uniref:14197_t:CDS:1 n=1 Tax=Cetraspora pellucida TaxID=1433469 RepID=A0ACA9KFQ4_9GLOM|nr:14197_t:CDS:2 [Cetraspora pellucida]